MKKQSIFLQLTPPQILVSGFVVIILTGAFLLTLPLASNDGVPLNFINALFTATSAVCVTGLVVVDTGTQFSLFGQIVILMLIQIGGLGFMTMATLVALMLKKRISLRERLILQEAMNQPNMEGIVRLIRRVLLYSFTIESTAALLYLFAGRRICRWDKPSTTASFMPSPCLMTLDSICLAIFPGHLAVLPYM